MLEEYGRVKKNYYMASLLVLIMGFAGAHRVYLGQIGIGIAMLVVWLIIGVAHDPIFSGLINGYSSLYLLTLLYGIFVFIEMIQIISVTDKVNDKIRRELEDKYYV